MKYWAVAIDQKLVDQDGNLCCNSADSYKTLDFHKALTLATMLVGARVVSIWFY